MILRWYHGAISETNLRTVGTTWIRRHAVPCDDADHARHESSVTSLRLDLLRYEVEDVLVTGEQRVETHVGDVSFVAVVVDGSIAEWQVYIGPEWGHHGNLLEDAIEGEHLRSPHQVALLERHEAVDAYLSKNKAHLVNCLRFNES